MPFFWLVFHVLFQLSKHLHDSYFEFSVGQLTDLHFLFILAVLGFCGSKWAFSSCSKQGLLSSCGAQASHWGSFSCGKWALGHVGFKSCSAQIWLTPACGIFPEQGSNRGPCTGSQISWPLDHQGSSDRHFFNFYSIELDNIDNFYKLIFLLWAMFSYSFVYILIFCSDLGIWRKK